MGSSARARCDLAMMAAERVNGSCTAKQQMEVGTQQQPSNSLKGPRDASVVRSARAEEGYHRRSPSVTRSHWPAFGKWPSPQRQLKKKSPTSSCLVPEVVRMARRVRARCPNDVRAREETTSGAVVVLAKGDVTDRTGDDDL